MWIEPITSVELRNILKSFSLNFPHHPTCDSLVREILKEHPLQGLVTAINSLSQGIVLAKETHRIHGEQLGSVRVFEVDIIRDKNQFCVFDKVIAFLHPIKKQIKKNPIKNI